MLTKTELNLTKWDTAEYLKTEKDIVNFLNAALEEDDPAFLIKAINEVARARRMNEIAKKMGVGRTALYKSLSGKASPSFARVFNVLGALGLNLKVSSAKNARRRIAGV